MLMHLFRLLHVLLILTLFVMVMMLGGILLNHSVVRIMVIVVLHAALHLHAGAVHHMGMHVMDRLNGCRRLRMTGVASGISLCRMTDGCLGQHRQAGDGDQSYDHEQGCETAHSGLSYGCHPGVQENVVVSDQRVIILCEDMKMNHLSVKTVLMAMLLFFAAPANAIEFEWQDASGAVKSLADYKGKPVILHFWASWCPPCRNEMPELQAWSKEHQDVALIVVALDRKFADADAFLKAEKIAFPTLMGDVSAAMRIGARGLPTTLVIGPESDIRTTRVGAVDWKSDTGGGAILKAFKSAI